MLVRNISIRELIVHAVASVTLLPDCVIDTKMIPEACPMIAAM
jgi:hypothetical protein